MTPSPWGPRGGRPGIFLPGRQASVDQVLYILLEKDLMLFLTLLNLSQLAVGYQMTQHDIRNPTIMHEVLRVRLLLHTMRLGCAFTSAVAVHWQYFQISKCSVLATPVAGLRLEQSGGARNRH